MKSKDEFRRTVMEKAERYEAERKARRKKVGESVLLCSICISVSLTIYLSSALDNSLKNECGLLENVETTAGDHTAMETHPSNNTEDSMFTDDNPSENAAIYHTTLTEKSPTAETTQTQTTDSTGKQNAFILDFSFAGSSELSESSSHEAQTLNSVSELEAYLTELYNRYEIPQTTIRCIQSAYSEEYFENHSLIALKIQDSVYRVLGSAEHSEYGRLSLTLQSTGKSDPLPGIQMYHYFITAKKENYSSIEINTEP